MYLLLIICKLIFIFCYSYTLGADYQFNTVVDMDWGSTLGDPYSRMKEEEEPPSFALSSDSDSDDSSDEGGLVMKKVLFNTI